MKSYVLVTGATGGLGKALAAECAARGWNLFLTDLHREALDKVARGLERLYGVNVLTAACDLTDADDRGRLWDGIFRQGLTFHMVLNVAGIDYQGPFDERQVRELNTIVRLNVEATVEMTRRVLARRDLTRTLHIVNVSSLAAFYPMPVKAVYAASKRFLLDWSMALAQELREQNVTVTALCPAGMPTTPACVRSIEAQGWLGRLTTVNAGDVAALTIRRALVGRRIVIPGLLNQMLGGLGSLVPRSLIIALINRRWSKAHRLAHASSELWTSSMVVTPR